jgi:hypothetical protein
MISRSPINGLRFRFMFFDYIYMLGECLLGISELHVKIQLVDRYCNKVLHNLHLLHRKGASREQMQEFVRKENQELLAGFRHHHIFYDKYRLRMIALHHAGTEGELLVDDVYNGSAYVVPVKQTIDTLLAHVFDSTPVHEMGLFEKERKVLELVSSVDPKPGETAQRVVLELHEAARNVHVYVKKEKLQGVEYLASGKPVMDPQVIVDAEKQETEKDRFLKDPLIREVFPQWKGALS